MISSLTKTLLAGLSVLTIVESFCPLCETAADQVKRWGFRLQDGRTCTEVYLELAGLSPSDASCIADKEANQEDCCGDEEPEPYDFPPTAPPQYQGPFGDEPDCKICGTDEYPGIPNAFIYARYVGEFNCKTLYDRGLNGMTPWFMCGPLQDFAEPVCGCGQYNPKCTPDDPTQCFGYEAPPNAAPNASPNASPNAAPTAAPNASPNAAPVQSPTPAPQVYVEPTVFDRKVKPQSGRYANRVSLSGGSGGAASRLRGNRGLVEGAHVQANILPELESPTESGKVTEEVEQ
jgi:hypothetical protein